MAVTLESLRKSVGKKNSKSKIFAWLADLELAAGDLDAALQRVNGGLTLYPHDIAAKLVRAKILFQKGDFEDCVKECESILVMDTFNLAAQKIMGDAYDKLENVVERNLCYRRYHDMDPLNNFWKDEYDVVPEAVAGAAAAAAAMDDAEFSMPAEGDDSFNLNLSGSGEENSEEKLDDLFSNASSAESNEESFGGSLFEKSSEQEVEDSVDKAFGDTFGEEADDALESEKSSSPFSSSFLDEVSEEQTPSAGQDSLADSFSDISLADDSLKMDEPDAENVASDDPFAALAAMLPNNDAADDEAIDELSASLNSVMDSIKADDSIDKPVEEFPADENVSGNDVNAALSDMFGLDDDLEAEETSAAAPADFSAVGIDESAEENASKVFETQSASADKPLSVDDAFSSIFGEDELPEEPATKVEEPVVDEPVAEEPVADKPLTVDDAFDSIFGEDELPEETAVAAEPVANVDEPAAAEPVIEEPAADKPMSVDGAFDSIFGEDELPEELPVEKAVEPQTEEDELLKLEDETLDVVDDSLELPAIEEPAPAAKPEADKALSVDDAFDSIFGEDELPEDQPAEKAAEEEPKFVEEVETPSDPIIASPMDFVNDESNSAVGNAFDSIFGAEDDNLTEADVAKPESSLAEQVNLADSELELPSVENKPETPDIAQEMGGAFASMFGDDDDLDLPDLKGESADKSDIQQSTSAALEEEIQAPEANNLSNDLDKSFDSLFGNDDDLSLPAEDTPVAGNPDLASLETEVSGAFKGLFDMEDDSLNEGESKPSNSGVDFLMSGDSDDEISAGLIKNPDAPLERGVGNLDDSMGTRTLAEIYFDQGLYADALKMYQELVQREPENEDLQTRMAEIEKICHDKFGGNA